MSVMPGAPVTLQGLRFDVAAMSEQGPRSENQDAYSIDAFPDAGLVALADGMGGERSGRVAAETALAALREHAPLRTLDDARRAVRHADATVARAAQGDPDAHGGMGCALGLLALATTGDGTGWIGAHVGDVRILSRAPDGTLRLETRDHTPAFARWEAGEISLDEIPDSAGANRLQRAVGRGGEPDVTWLPARPGWSWLLVSDGIYKAVRLDELAHLMDAPTAGAAVEGIRRKVEERGPDDNFTAVVVRALGDHAAAPPPPDRTLFMGTADPAPPPRAGRSALGAVAALLALLALAAAGFAYWTARQADEASRAAVAPATVDSLRSQIDSLRTRMAQFDQPFGPSETAPAGTVAPAPRPARPDSVTRTDSTRGAPR